VLGSLRSEAGGLQGQGVLSARGGLVGEQLGNICLLSSFSNQSSFVGNVLREGDESVLTDRLTDLHHHVELLSGESFSKGSLREIQTRGSSDGDHTGDSA
jgi:hypothetical protein